MAAGSTQPVTEMSTRIISWEGKGDGHVGLTTLPPSCVDCLKILGASTSWNPQGLFSPVQGLLNYVMYGSVFGWCFARIFREIIWNYIFIIIIIIIITIIVWQLLILCNFSEFLQYEITLM
jgi:hypothetical protein